MNNNRIHFSWARPGHLLVALFLLACGGCAWLGASQEEKVLRTGSSPATVIPEGLDEPIFVDIMPIPEIIDYRNLADADIEIGLPDALSTRFGVEQIVIRKLGDIQWVFVDRATALVWPDIVSYFESHDIPIADLDPRNGILETEWVEAYGDTGEAIFANIIGESLAANAQAVESAEVPSNVDGVVDSVVDSAAEPSDPAVDTEETLASVEQSDSATGTDPVETLATAEPAEAAAGIDSEETPELVGPLREGADASQAEVSQHRFRIRVEPGVRTGSTELHVQHRQQPQGAPFRLTDIDWSPGSNGESSDNKDIELATLSALAYYLGDRASQDPSVSLLAGSLEERESKAALEPQAEGMVLKYKLGFDRAWATVGAALENARIEVEDLDRSSSNYYVHYTSAHDPDPGFFSRLFSSDDESDSVNKFTIHLKPMGEETHVTVMVGGVDDEADAEADTVADSASGASDMDTLTLLLTERLLKLIKEYST